MRKFLSTVDAISDWSGKIFSFLAVIVIGVIAYEVVSRYGFKSPTIWAGEAMTYLCGIYYVMGGAYTLRLRGHVKVDMLYERFSPRIRAILDLITFPLFLLFLGTLLWTAVDFSWQSTKIAETTGTSWSPPIFPVKIMIPLAAFLVLLQGIAKFIHDLNIASTGGEAK